jgi:hypothetical protein
MISVVNGYVCTSSCDVAAAKQGRDPNAPPGALPGDNDKKTNSLAHRPATILDGALKDLANAGAAGDASAAGNAAQPPSLNLLV